MQSGRASGTGQTDGQDRKRETAVVRIEGRDTADDTLVSSRPLTMISKKFQFLFAMRTVRAQVHCAALRENGRTETTC
jgi:hypothetical protein